MNIADGGAVFEGHEGTNAASCAFPAICVLPTGRWLCSFRAAPAKARMAGQHVRLTWSDDEGRSWTDAAQPFAPEPVDGRPGLFRGIYMTSLGGARVLAVLMWVDHSDPDLPFFNEETEGLLDTKIFLTESEDAGETWPAPRLMDTSPFDCPTPLTGPILRMPNGELVCQFELNKHYYETASWRHSSVVMISTDGGRTWPEHAIAANDPANRVFYWDQRPGLLDNGSILDLFWTYDNGAAIYLNAHASRSVDGGRTWSDLWDTGVPCQPAQPVSLPDGRIAMVYVDRTTVPTVKLRTSADGARTWPADTEIVLHAPQVQTQTRAKADMEDAWAEMEEFSVGLPNTTLLAGGNLLVVYYAGPRADLTDVRWLRIAT